jgi:hypothetical protein
MPLQKVRSGLTASSNTDRTVDTLNLRSFEIARMRDEPDIETFSFGEKLWYELSTPAITYGTDLLDFELVLQVPKRESDGSCRFLRRVSHTPAGEIQLALR